MRRYDGIFLDCDGVLMDTEPLHCACWARLLEPYGIRLDWETYRLNYVGISDREMIDALRHAAGCQVPLEVLWANYVRKKDLFLRHVLADPPVPESVRRLIQSLNGYKLAVVSSSSRSEIEPLLVTAGLRGAFQALVCGEDVQRPKPAPEPYLLAAERLGVRTALVVEDSDVGEASGRAAGFDVLRVTSPHELPHKLTDWLTVNRFSRRYHGRKPQAASE